MIGKNILKIVIPAIMGLVLVLASCTSGGATQSSSPTSAVEAGVKSTDSTRYKPVWIDPEITGEQVAAVLSTVEASKMAHFWVNMQSGKEGFMAYRLDGVIYVRANTCPPCRSYNFSLEKGILVCDTCGTRFNAKTGQGISGACVNYPKSEVATELKDGKLTMTLANLASAYAETLKMG